jgi:hypothetical protein
MTLRFIIVMDKKYPMLAIFTKLHRKDGSFLTMTSKEHY